MKRSSAISRRASIALNRLRTEVSPKPSTSSSLIFALRACEREDVGRLLDPALLEEQLDLLLAQPLDVEGAARDEMPQVLDLLNGQANSPVQRRARPPRRPAIASRTTSVLQRTRAFLREMIGLGVLRPLLEHDVEHLRDDVAGALDRSPCRRCARPSRSISSSLCSVAFCTTTPPTRDRLELGDRRERAGAADLDLDVA